MHLSVHVHVCTCKFLVDNAHLPISRAELKAEEWRNRVIDEKFLPFSRTRKPYQSLIHTQSSYKKPVYGLRVEREIKKQVRTVLLCIA